MSAADPRPQISTQSPPRDQRYIGRFAPSPTGPLHFGSLIAAVASYADAKSVSGEWLLRIEDLDPPREQPGAADLIIRTLERYGFQWDGPIVYQSARDALYEEALERLRARDSVYPCGCTRVELSDSSIGIGGERVYPGTCRNGLPPARNPRAWRLRVDDTPIGFTDRVQGPQQQVLARDVGDFILRRADNLWAYQLAVVVDDAEQRITDVVRGADLLASTPRQIWLQRQLGLATPRYAHVPVAANAHGEKLSKQTLAHPLPTERMGALLCAAWRFLDQPGPDADLDRVDEFWHWALPRWQPRLLPPVANRPFRAAEAVGL